MPRNRSTSDSRKPILEDMDIEEIKVGNQEICLPFLKQLLRHRAYESWHIKKNEKTAIFYQTITFCLKCLEYRDCKDDAVKEFLEQLKKELCFQMSDNQDISLFSRYSNFEHINKYLDREIISTCRNQFPKEWTVIQLCKSYNPLSLSGKSDDIVSFNAGISMAVFKHSAVKDLLLIELKKPQFLENVFDKAFKLNKIINENSQIISNAQSQNDQREARERYLKATQEIGKYVQEIVNILSSFFGPWFVALTGNFKSRKSIETENEIRKRVMEFLSTRISNFDDYQQKLIHLVARRSDLLTHQQIFVAITYILQDKPDFGYSDVDLNDLYDHLTWIKQEYKYDDTSTHPCILIVDELLDQLPIEMINTNQEFTRICSFANLKRLWESNSHLADNSGYVLSQTANCQAIVNPDGSLTAMEDRLRKFYTYWLPSWKVYYREKPTSENYCEMLSQSDVLAYSGHGSGLNLLNENGIKFKSKTVVFLFGCSSTSLQSCGLNSEMNGAHNYYHIGSCPCVVGFLWTVSDFPTDLCSTRLLSSWIPNTTSKPHWQLIDKNLWKKNNSLAFTRVCDHIVTSPSLPEVITKIRGDAELPMSLRASLVYRGIPVMATSSNSRN